MIDIHKMGLNLSFRRKIQCKFWKEGSKKIVIRVVAKLNWHFVGAFGERPYGSQL